MRQPSTSKRKEPIAITGIGCRFPGGVHDPNSFDDLLRNGKDAITEFPRDRPLLHRLREFSGPGPSVPAYGGFLDSVDCFDEQFFHISSREAIQMDPQQRVLLEVAYEAIADAGIPCGSLRGSDCGVYVGIYNNDYRLLAMHDPHNIDAYTGTGTIHAIGANRLSYLLDLRGPSLALDTTCSSSLAAVHLACQALRSGETSIALAGGVNLILSPLSMLSAARVVTLAADGHCKTFDASADGIVRSEGCGVVVLKRLAQALRDGDRIYAVIRGSAVNQDGRSNGMTAPNPEAQEAVLRLALAQAAIDPTSIGYIEAHGTGTPVGDPIEAEALRQVFPHEFSCGSVKTNLGHMESAAGIAGLIKTALMLRNKFIAPHLHLRQINPLVRESAPNLRIPQCCEEWRRIRVPRRAGVSAFSLGGTNAHAVLEEAPESPRYFGVDGPHWLPLSAVSETALEHVVRDYVRLLEDPRADVPLAQVCYTAGARRDHFEHRLSAVAEDRASMAEALKSSLRGMPGRNVATGNADRAKLVAFAFPGQGARWEGVGLQLLALDGTFRQFLQNCDRIVNQQAGWSLITTIESGCFLKTERAQPVIFAIQAGLVNQLKNWGIRPDAVIGHSLGEATAAWAAGALPLEESFRLLLLRGRLTQSLNGLGCMAVLDADCSAVEVLIRGTELSIACLNSDHSTTISGSPGDIAAVMERARTSGISCTQLHTAIAFHSLQMAPAATELGRQLGQVRTGECTIPIYSSVTGEPVENAHQLSTRHWQRNLANPVRFAEAAKRLASDGYDLVLEIGPYPLLGRYLRHASTSKGIPVQVIAALSGPTEERSALRQAASRLYAQGCAVDWRCLNEKRGVVSLPVYPWQRRRHWLANERSFGFEGLVQERSRAREQCAPAARQTFYDVNWVWNENVRPAEVYEVAKEQIEGLCVQYCRAALRSLAGPNISLDDLETKTPLLRRVREIARREAPHRFLVETAAEVQAQYPRLAPELSILARCGEALPRILIGQEDPVAVVFGSDDSRRVYRESPFAKHFHPLLNRQLRRELSQRTGTVRILEVGAGTGGTTSAVLNTLNGADFSYTFTDKSAVFFASARAEFGECPRFECRILDLDLDLAGQGFAEESVDVIIASNVLHATRNVAAAVEALRRLGHPNSALFILEGTGNVIWADLTFGLTLGWSESTHRDVRDTGPLLRVDRWPQILKQSGWADSIRVFRGPGAETVLIHAGGMASSFRSWLLVHNGEIGERDKNLLIAQGDRVDQCRIGMGCDILDGIRLANATDVVFLHHGNAGPVDALPNDETSALLQLMRGMVAASDGTERKLWLVTTGAESTNKEPGDPGQAPLRGLARVFAAEYPELWGGMIDIDPLTKDWRQLVDLLTLPQTQALSEDRLATRDGRSLCARLRRVVPENLGLPTLDAEGVYLVTGGTGGIGCLIARELVRFGARRLVLVSRRGESHPSLDKNIQELRRLELKELQVRAIDVAALGEVEQLINEFGKQLRGIVHAAGEIADGTIPTISADSFRAAASGKILGAWNLHQVTEKLQLQFFVMFSSAVTVLGMPGLGAYTAANEFLDQLAVLRRRHGLPAIAIDWSGWKGVGMAEHVGGIRQRQWEAQGLTPLETPESLDAFGLLLAAVDLSRCAVMQVDWTSYLTRYPAGRVPAFYQEVTPPVIDSSPRLPAETQPDAGDPAIGSIRREDDVAALIVAEIERLSSIPPYQITGRTALLSLGLDSLMAVELRNALARTLRLKLPATLLFDHATLDELTGYLCRLLKISTKVGKTHDFQELLEQLDGLPYQKRAALRHQLKADCQR